MPALFCQEISSKGQVDKKEKGKPISLTIQSNNKEENSSFINNGQYMIAHVLFINESLGFLLTLSVVQGLGRFMSPPDWGNNIMFFGRL